MAAISAANTHIVFKDGKGEKTVLYRLHDVTTADTLDVSAEFSKIKKGTFLAAGTLATIGTVTPTGTSLALTLTDLADDTVWLLVVGQSA